MGWNIRKAPGKNNTSGATGVCYSKDMKKWIAYVNFEKKQKHLGTYLTKELALEARNAWLQSHSDNGLTTTFEEKQTLIGVQSSLKKLLEQK